MATSLKLCGGPLGTELVIDNYSVGHTILILSLPSCRVVTLIVAAGPPPALV